MSYQIVARVEPFADANDPASVERLASLCGTKSLASMHDVHVSRDGAFVEFVVYLGDADAADLTRKLCGMLIDGGILAFDIWHSV